VPLSFAQQRLWFLDQLEPRGSSYNIPLALRLEGDLAASALAAAVAEVVRRHEALRTVFSSIEGEPVQVVRSAAYALPRVDLAGMPQSWREIELRRLARDEARRPFDVALDAGAPGCRGARAAALRAPHRERRLVYGDSVARGDHPVRGGALRAAVASAGTAGAVRRLCAVATRVAVGRRSGRRDLVLAWPPRRSAAGSGAAHRPSASG